MTRAFMALVACVMVYAPAAHAQTRATTGDLRVIATDESALPLPGIGITLVHAETGLERTAMTGQDGHAMAAALAVGRYTLRAELDAFRPVMRDDITIELGATTELRLTLQLASRAETIDVVAPQPLVDVQRTVVSTVISERQIADLPIDRRNHISFAGQPAAAMHHRLHAVPGRLKGWGSRSRAVARGPTTSPSTASTTTTMQQVVCGRSSARTPCASSRWWCTGIRPSSEKPGGVVNIVTRSGTNRSPQTRSGSTAIAR